MFGRDAPTPETLSLQLPPDVLPADPYAQELIAKMKDEQENFSTIKSALCFHQRELYDAASCDLHIPDGKLVYVQKDCLPSGSNKVSHFIRNYDGPYLVTGHPYKRSDLLNLHKVDTGENFPRPVNIEKVVVAPESASADLRPPDEILVEPDIGPNAEQGHANPNADLVSVAFEFGKYLESLPNKSAVSSQACKFVYEHFPATGEILTHHGRLIGLVKLCPYLQLEGGLQGVLTTSPSIKKFSPVYVVNSFSVVAL